MRGTSSLYNGGGTGRDSGGSDSCVRCAGGDGLGDGDGCVLCRRRCAVSGVHPDDYDLSGAAGSENDAVATA